MGLNFTPCIYFIDMGSGTELLLLRTADGVCFRPAFVRGTARSQTCASTGVQSLLGNVILEQTSNGSGLLIPC